MILLSECVFFIDSVACYVYIREKTAAERESLCTSGGEIWWQNLKASTMVDACRHVPPWSPNMRVMDA